MPPPVTRLRYAGLVLCGALLGAMLVLALNVWDILSGHFDASDPFIHVLAETFLSAGAGATLSVLLGFIHSRFAQRI